MDQRKIEEIFQLKRRDDVGELDRQVFEYDKGFIIRWAYRRAEVTERTATLPGSAIIGMREWFKEKTGKETDNHTVFGLSNEKRRPMFVQFSDGMAYFGHAVIERNQGP